MEDRLAVLAILTAEPLGDNLNVYIVFCLKHSWVVALFWGDTLQFIKKCQQAPTYLRETGVIVFQVSLHHRQRYGNTSSIYLLLYLIATIWSTYHCLTLIFPFSFSPPRWIALHFPWQTFIDKVFTRIMHACKLVLWDWAVSDTVPLGRFVVIANFTHFEPLPQSKICQPWGLSIKLRSLAINYLTCWQAAPLVRRKTSL